MKLYVYIVNFEIHQNCQIKDYIYICTAQNAKEACKTARYFWKQSNGHQFHIHAVRSTQQDPDKAHVQDWKGCSHDGPNAFDRYICTGWKTWRFKASNGQYVYPLMNV